MLTFNTATLADIPVIRHIADKTWWPTYSSILNEVQISYMLNAIYSEAALTKVISEGQQQFILLREADQVVGFAAFSKHADESSAYKLNKLYVLPSSHGKGYGQKLIDEVVRLIRREGAKTLVLNVNRYNPAKSFYERYGFVVVGEEDVPIGPYFMNDYVMRLQVG